MYQSVSDFIHVNFSTLHIDNNSMSKATFYHAPLGVQDKGCSNKWLVVCYVVRLNGKGLILLGHVYVQGVFFYLVVVRMAIELKYRKTPQNHIITTIFFNQILLVK